MIRPVYFFLAFILSALIPLAARAQIVVLGNGPAQACYLSAKTGNSGTQSAIRECEHALKNIVLSRKDEAATHTNLGILLMRKGDYKTAQIHYKRAIELRPKTAEAYINYGASLIYAEKYQDAISTLNTAIDLGTEKMPEALYNRSIAYNRVEDYKKAYKDLKQALLLKPEWPVALKALENYKVIRRSQTN